MRIGIGKTSISNLEYKHNYNVLISEEIKKMFFPNCLILFYLAWILFFSVTYASTSTYYLVCFFFFAEYNAFFCILRSEMARALKAWSDVSALEFREVSSNPDILIFFASGSHGDGGPFDGAGK